MTELISGIESEMVAIGLAIAVIGVIGLGMVMIAKSLKGAQGLRETIGGLGGIFIAVILIGAAPALVQAVDSLASTI